MVERAALALLASIAIVSAARAQEPVRIFAAASLTDALSEVIKGYEAANPGAHVVPQFGGSNDLARQILAGAPAHLFFSADEKQMDRLAAEGAIDGGSRRDVLSNQLVIVEGASGPARIHGARDLEGAAKIALADPEAVPAGVYARRYLETLGLWESVRPKVVPTLDVRAALAAVASGNVEAGLVYKTDAILERRVRVAFEVPRGEGPRIVYPLALVKGAGEAAQAFHRYLASPEARSIFDRYGFGRAEEK